MVDQLNDLTLDNPSLKDNFHAIYEECVSLSIIEAADQSILLEAERRGVEGEAHVHTVTVAAFKQDAVATIQEYFNSTDVGEVVLRLTVRTDLCTCSLTRVTCYIFHNKCLAPKVCEHPNCEYGDTAKNCRSQGTGSASVNSRHTSHCNPTRKMIQMCKDRPGVKTSRETTCCASNMKTNIRMYT